MKGSQGLDALATLCGGASKASYNESSSSSNENFSQSSPQNRQNQNNGNSTQSRQMDHFANAPVGVGYMNNTSNNESNSSNNQQMQGMNHLPPQLAALLNAGLSQQSLANAMASSPNEGAFQHMFYLNLLQNQANAKAASSILNPHNQASSVLPPSFLDQNAALAMVLALQQQEAATAVTNQLKSHQMQEQQQDDQHQQQQQQQQQQTHSQFRQIIPPPSSQSSKSNNTNNGINCHGNQFPAPLPKTNTENTAGGVPGSPGNTSFSFPLLMRNPHTSEADSSAFSISRENEETADQGSGSASFHPEDKKLQKRAANRRSAQLSRKRKKQFIEDLKDENTELRRMELILRSIPDLVVSFDSSGKIGFVSQSVSNFLEFKPEELEGKSFWERLCDDSVRLLKAAFMDALAARESDSTSTPLGAGVWELRLQDKNGDHILVTLNGVVHFTGDAPECVCSMRLREKGTKSVKKEEDHTAVEASTPLKPKILPHQSVFSNNNVAAMKSNVRPNKRHAAQISDVDSTSTSD